MGAGVTLLVLGAVLAFAVRGDVPVIDLTVTGLILMLAGGLLIWYQRHRDHRRQLVQRLDHTDPTSPPVVVEELVQEYDD